MAKARILKVGNLGSAIDVNRLGEIFAEFGSVVGATLAESQYSGVSRGFGYIEMASDSEANNCIEKLNGQERGGRVLSVVEAPPEIQKKRRKRKS